MRDIVLEVIEGNTNNNEAETNELGNTFRSSCKANLEPNGMVGSLLVKSLSTGQIDTISAGKMTHDERRYYFENQDEIIGKIVKYKHFTTGVKEKKRFPRFIGFRLEEDM
jgi:DNA ligase-1